MSTVPPSRRLTNAQALLLQLFDRDLSESELNEMRRVLTKHLAQKAEAEAERVLVETGQTAKDIDRDSVAINQNRTAYLRQIRSGKA